MQEIASVFGYLLTSLGDHAYATAQEKLPARRIIGIFHSLTWSKYKTRVSQSFKGSDGVLRVVIASSALSMGFNYPEVRYVIHLGPARSIVDHIQQAGRAERDGCQSHNVVLYYGQQLSQCGVLYYGQQLSQCEQAVKEFVKANGFFRKELYKTLDSGVDSVMPLHDCCNSCANSCSCSHDSCDILPLPFETAPAAAASEVRNSRSVTPVDKETLKEAIVEYKNSLSSNSSLVLDRVTSHGFSDCLVEDVLTFRPEIFTLTDVLEKLPVFSLTHAKAILEIFDEIVEDVYDCGELMGLLEDGHKMESIEHLWNDHYFDISDSDSDDPDRIHNEELENL